MMTDFFDLNADKQSSRLTGLARNILDHWGVSNCEPRLIKYRENAVFEVKTSSGKSAVLRVHRQGYHSHESLTSELEWMKMLSKGGVVVPVPIPASSGAMIVNATAEGVPGVWKVDMLSWLQGKELGNVGEPLEIKDEDIEKLFFEIGMTMGELHNLSTAWREQNTMTRHAWDCDGFVGEEPLWGRFWELAALTPAQKSFFLKVKDSIAEDLYSYGRTTDNYGLIHADLVPENIMVDRGEVQLIDFDDAGFGWHMFEIATSLFWLAKEPAFDTIVKSVLDGYQSVRSLQQRDLDTMKLFFAARSLTYLGWVHTRQNTQTAMELTPIIIENAKEACSKYLSDRS
jgi:Ser/Thr protein kinase RdoA (MazF antagonist)